MYNQVHQERKWNNKQYLIQKKETKEGKIKPIYVFNKYIKCKDTKSN